jgi:hypothetical protein
MDIVREKIELPILQAFGYDDVHCSISRGLDALQTAIYRYPDEPELKQPFWIKYNRARDGNLHKGSKAPNPIVYSLNNLTPERLYSETNPSQTTIILAGSIT